MASSGLTCDEAKAIWSDYQVEVEKGNIIGSGGFAQVGEWECHAFPFAERPKVAACESGQRIFNLVETAESGNGGQLPPKVKCGNLPGPLSNNVFDIEGEGESVDCTIAKQVTQAWLDAECGAKPPGTACTVLRDYRCTLKSTGYETSAITCEGGGWVIRFSTGA